MADNLKRKCCKCGLSPHDDPNIKLHRFPKPGSTNMRRCEMWAKYCFPDKVWSSLDFQRKLYSEHRMLCNKHFKDSEFISIEEKKLCKHAVPDMIDFDEEIEAQPMKKLHDDNIQVSFDKVYETDICDDNDDDNGDSDALAELNVCRVCLALDVKMYDLKDVELREIFQNITGLSVTENNHSILERLCWECAGRLKTAAAFRNKALLSDTLLQGLASTGEQIRKNDITLIKENEDYLKSAATLSIVEVFHTVEIDAENVNVPSILENNVTEIIRKDTIEEESSIEVNNDEMDVEEELIIETPIKTVIENDPICPNTSEENRYIVLQTNPLLSNNIIIKVNTINPAYSSPLPGCSHVEPKYPILGHLLKTPDDSEDKIKKTVIKITNRDAILKIVSIKSKEVISHDHRLKGDAKFKNIDVKVVKRLQIKNS